MNLSLFSLVEPQTMSTLELAKLNTGYRLATMKTSKTHNIK